MPRFEKLVLLPAVRLSRLDMEELVQVLVSNMNSDEVTIRFSVSDGEATHSFDSLEEFLSYKVPRRVDKLMVSASSDEFCLGSDKLYLSVGASGNFLSIESSDEVWFKGKIIQVKELFDRHRPWYGGMQHGIMRHILSVFLGILIAIFFMSEDLIQLAVSGIAAVAIALLLFPYPKGGLFPMVDIRIVETKKWFEKPAASLFVAGLAAIATLGLFVLTLLQFMTNPQ